MSCMYIYLKTIQLIKLKGTHTVELSRKNKSCVSICPEILFSNSTPNLYCTQQTASNLTPTKVGCSHED